MFTDDCYHCHKLVVAIVIRYFSLPPNGYARITVAATIDAVTMGLNNRSLVIIKYGVSTWFSDLDILLVGD